MSKTEFASYFAFISEEQLLSFEKYHMLILEWNKKINLTSIIDENEVYIKHFYDSLKLFEMDDFTFKKVCDLGSGAGFPGIPLAIVQNELDITLLEPMQKRANFLKIVQNELSLHNVKVRAERAEDYQKKHRESFDIITSRAVANLSILLELSIPLLKVGGVMLAMKGSTTDEELQNAANALKELGSEIVEIRYFDLPCDMGKRSIIKIRKMSKTKDIYPRKYAKIKRKTL